MNWLAILERLRLATGLTDKQVAAMEKRTAWRITRRVGLLGFSANGEKVECMALNFGPGGLLIESPKRFRKNEMLRIRLARLRDGAEHRVSLEASKDDVQVRVLWCRRHKDALVHQAGLQFMTDDPQMRRTTARFLLEDCKLGITNPKEKRKAPRAQASMQGFVGTRDGATIEVKVLDLAIGGALLHCPSALERGSPVDLKIFLSKDLPALDCKGTVVRNIRNDARSCELGIYFTEVPPDHQERLIQVLSQRLQA